MLRSATIVHTPTHHLLRVNLLSLDLAASLLLVEDGRNAREARFPAPLPRTQELGTASQSTARMRRAHSQHMHDAHTSPLPPTPTAKMQSGAACQRMCSGTRTQLSFTMHLQHVRVLASQLVAEHADRGELEVSTQKFHV